MVNPEVEARWAATLAAVESVLSDASRVSVRIPGWQPLDLDAGLYWLRMQIYEGFQVGFLVERRNRGTLLWLKSWEDGWESGEPNWDDVKATPIAPPNEANDIW